MRKRSLVFVALAAVLLTGFPSVEAACGLGATVDHGCCRAEERPAPVDACCSSEPAAPTPSSSDRMACDCVHRVATPAVVATDTTNRSDDDSNAIGTVPSLRVPKPAAQRAAIDRAPARSHPPPPAYLLDCAFLN